MVNAKLSVEFAFWLNHRSANFALRGNDRVPNLGRLYVNPLLAETVVGCYDSNQVICVLQAL